MQPHLVAAKTRIPATRAEVVPRYRLVERLCDGLSQGGGFARRLSLISAPAGFGKTTLAGLWVRHCLQVDPRLRVAWLSLDEGDRDPALFVSHLRAALQGAAPAVGAAARADGETLMTALLNELADLETRILLVLDDYHAASGEEVDRAIALLIDFLPPHLHAAIFTRVEPELPLARYRARGQVMELRAEDLCFGPAEAADFLRRTMNLSITEGELATLEQRTEGWVAGLQLAALSLRGRRDTAAFISSFAGSHRFVVDYLVEEVLLRETAEVRNFLLRTSILDELCVPLCDAVAGGNGRAMLDALERANLFLVPLDDQREWYRYHALFAEALRSRLATERSAETAGLHGRASAWYAREGFPEEAIRHALAARDFGSAASLIELRWHAMDVEYRSAAWLEWARQLPEDIIRTRPVLSLGYGWALLDTGDLEASEERFRDAENPAPGMLIADEEQYRSLPSSIAVARAYRALALGDIPGTVDQARRAATLAPAGDHLRRTAAASLLGLALYAEGDLRAAEDALSSCMSITRAAGRLAEALGMVFLLAEIRVSLGRLRDAERACADSLRLATEWKEPIRHVTADLHRAMGEILLERGSLDAAGEELRIGRDQGEEASTTDWRYRVSKTEARAAEARGDFQGALELLDEAERFHIRTPLPEVRPVDAMRARIWIRLGDAAKALSWAGGRGLSIDGPFGFLDEFGHLTLARALIARFGADQDEATIESATSLLERLLAAAETGGRRGGVIEVLALLALAQGARGDTASALASLDRAVGMAEPEGYALVFLAEGPPMASLLKRLEPKTAAPPARAHVHALLSMGARDEHRRPSPPADAAAPRPLLEPLSDRELHVLRLLGTDLGGPEIARELYISLNTFRTHTKNIFDKLGVNSRRAAVSRAAALGLPDRAT